MSPILVRPVREQFEHDRVIRLLQARWRRRFEVTVNVGAELTSPLRFGPRLLFPDLILTANDRARRLHSLVEVETNESVNHLEAMAEWFQYSRVRAAFHLYVPAGSVEVTRRLCAEKKVAVAEIWSYHAVGAQMRFTLAYRAPAKSARRRKSGRATKKASRTASTKRKTTVRGSKTSKPAARRAPARTSARRARQKPR